MPEVNPKFVTTAEEVDSWVLLTPEEVAKFSPDQPRAPSGPKGGQWIAGVQAGPATALHENVRLEPGMTEEEFLATLTDEERAAIANTEEELAEEPPTDASVEEGGFIDENGLWTEERQELHQQILDAIFTDEAIAAATPEAGEDSTVIFMGGRPGSGKTTTLKAVGLGFDESKYLVINSDDIKAQLPDYLPHLAGLYHEESSFIVDQVEDIARSKGLNVVYDATMRTTRGVLSRVAAYKDAGYALEGHYIYASPLTSAQRSVKRFMKGGRFVPPRLSLTSQSNERSFDTVAKGFRKWAVYNNNGSFVEGPTLVAEGGTE